MSDSVPTIIAPIGTSVLSEIKEVTDESANTLLVAKGLAIRIIANVTIKK
ncbi:hypothetical protein YTPLAS73_02100 [Nitrosarchaeum sp.]|nr:hypothetical protein YTPLAS73_02100 [Nitrosarchaeum sp.]